MVLARRTLLRSGALAAGGIVLAGGGAATFLATRTPHRALAPWDEAVRGSFGDPRERALAYAVLAPNPHNRQPWLVELRGSDEAGLFCDLGRRLPETDPFDRQITIGLGCFLELFRMAAAREGFRAEITPFPEGEPVPRLDGRPIAAMRLVRAAPVEDPLFASVLARRSTKEPFDTARPLPAEALAAVTAGIAGAGATVEPVRVAALRELTWQGFVRETETRRTFFESVRLMRIGRAEIEAMPDGIDIGGPVPEALRLAGLLTRATIADPGSTAHAETMRRYREMMLSAMGYVWLETADNTRRAQLAVGRDWVRMNLRATGLGIAIHPLSQVLQEFPEIAELKEEAHRLLAARPGGRVQMLARLGYGPQAPASPRWPLATRLVPA